MTTNTENVEQPNGRHSLDAVVRSLSPRMAAAYEKLSQTEWLTPYDLREKLPTLQGLVSRGLAVSKGYGALGAAFSPRTTICFKRSNEKVSHRSESEAGKHEE